MVDAWLRKPEEWGVEPVPPEKRNLRALDLGILWFSLGVGLLVLFTGALLVSLGLSLFEVLVVSIVGSIIGSLMLAAAGRSGARHGVPTMVSLRPVLGRKASWIPSGLNAFQLFGWASFELMIMGLGLTAITRPFLGAATPYVWIAILTVWVTLLALGGPVVVVRQWLERVAVWLVIGGTLWLSYIVVTQPAFATEFFVPRSPADRPLGLALDLVIVMPISWWPLVADYNRFAARARDSFVGTFVGYTISNTWFYVLGAATLVVFGFTALATPITFVGAVVATGLGAIVLLAIIADETDNAFANVYSSAVSLQNIAPKARQRGLILVASGIGFVAGSLLASLGESFAIVYEGFLFFIGGIFVPLLGVMVADQFVRRGYEPGEFADGSPPLKILSLIAWVVGIVVYFALVGVSLAGASIVPQVLASPIGASLPSFAVAAGVHVLASRLAAPAAGRAPS